MIRKALFLWLIVPAVLALPAATLAASPMNAHMGHPPAAATVSSMSTTINTGNADASAWRNATFALIGVLLVGALVLGRDRRPVTIGLVVTAGLVVVGIAFAQARFGSNSTDMVSMGNARGSGPVPVALVRVRRNPGGTSIAAPATLQPYLIQDIVVRVPGLLTDLSAYAGDRLHAGEVVARLDEPELQENAQAAESAAQAAQSQRFSVQDEAAAMQADVYAKQQRLRYWEAELARERWLLRQGAVSVQEYQDERAQAAAAQSGYDAARAKLGAAHATIRAALAQAAQASWSARAQSAIAGYTTVIVPDDAVVMKRLVDPGVYVQPGTPILRVAVINRLRVQAQVAQQDLAGVQIGIPIDVIFDSGTTLHSRVSSISPVVDPATHTAIAEAIMPNTGDAYQPGAFVHVILHSRGIVRRNSFLVPSGAIVGGATTAVWTDLNGAAHRVPVTVLSDDGTSAQVSGDLQPGTRVVVTGAADLEEGQAITESPQ